MFGIFRWQRLVKREDGWVGKSSKNYKGTKYEKGGLGAAEKTQGQDGDF